METLYHLRCKACGYDFQVGEGADFFGLQLHCDRCRRERYVAFESVRALYERFEEQVQALSALAGIDEDPLTSHRAEEQALAFERAYEHAVEDTLAPCVCGGRYRFERDTPCPNCGSVRCY